MITPRFTLKQNESFVIVILHVPYIKISNSQFFIEGTEFKFYIKPYYLRLNFSQEIEENGREKATYDVDKGDVTVYIPKKNEGEYFDDLDITSKLLAPKQPKHDSWLIEDITDESGQEFDWSWDQDLPKESKHLGIQYGFNNCYSQFYVRFLSEYPDVLWNKNPEQLTNNDRRQHLISEVIETFDMEHYLCDYLSEKDLTPSFSPLYKKESDWIDNLNELVLQLPRKQLLIDSRDVLRCLYGIADILFAFLYDHIMNEGEESPESCWNICRLSSQLSWLHNPDSIDEAIYLNFLQALTYPLYRNYRFCQLVLEELKYITTKGKSLIYQCLLKVYSLFLKHEFYHLHNNTFIKDYILFVQQLKPIHIEQLCKALESVKMKKADLPFPIEEFEEYCAPSVSDNNPEETSDSESSDDDEEEEEEESESESESVDRSSDDTDSEQQSSVHLCSIAEDELTSGMASLAVDCSRKKQPLIVEI